MKHGSEWYKRDPQAYLGGVQGMTEREHAVYSVVIELIYAHGGSVNNDPKWISGWFKDIGTAAVRNTIQNLHERKKLILEGDQITQKTAKNISKTREELRETRVNSGRSGGVSSGKSRRASKENSNLDEAVASNKTKQRREEKSNTPLSPKGEGDLFGGKKAEPSPAEILSAIIPVQLAEDFVEHRRRMGKKHHLTDLAARQLAKKWGGYSNRIAAFEQSIANGWQGVFEVKQTQQRGPAHMPTDGIGRMIENRSRQRESDPQAFMGKAKTIG